MRYYSSVILNLLFLFTHAQGFRIRHTLPGVSTSYSKAIFETSPGNYIGAGIVLDSATGANQICITGLNATGQMLWTKKYGHKKFNYLHNPFISRSYYKQGNYIYHAGIALDSTNKYQGVFIKFNLNGDTLWQNKFYEPNDYVYPQMLVGSVDGGFLITGLFEDPVNPNRYVMLIKTNANGIELWRKKISKVNPNAGDGKAIIQDSATKKIVISGYQYLNAPGPYDNILITDSLGIKLSQHNYLTGPGGAFFDMIQTKDKKIVAVGLAQSTLAIGGYSLQQSYIVKFDLNNPTLPIWKIKNYGKFTLSNSTMCLRELSDSTLLIGSRIDTLEMTGAQVNLLIRINKISPSGTVLWNRFYNYRTIGSTALNYQTIRSLNLCADGSWISAIECFNPGVKKSFIFY